MHEQITLAYVGVRGNPEEWTAFAADLHGMQPVQGDDRLRFRIDDRAWRIEVDPDGAPGLAFIGFEWRDERQFETMLERMRGAGYAIVEDPDLAARRNVARLTAVAGPGGVRFEFCTHLADAAEPFVSPTGARFVTGRLGMGHVGVRVFDLDQADRFLMEMMGLRATDWAKGGHFFRGGPRHHLVVTVQATPETGEGLHHFFVELEQLAMVGRAWDKVEAGAAPIALTLGQHSNDPTTSYYCVGPSGVGMEYGWNAMTVDDDSWTPREWNQSSFWGHRRPSPAPRAEG